MSPMIIGLICTVSLGALMTIIAFIRQILYSRNTKMNEQAQVDALKLENKILEDSREQFKNDNRFSAHYLILKDNKEQIALFDEQIMNTLQLKTDIIKDYAQDILKQSNQIITTQDNSDQRREICKNLRKVIDDKIVHYDNELKNLQEERAKLRTKRLDFQDQLLKEEKERNQSLNAIYKDHSAILEKIMLRHIGDAEMVSSKNIEASSSAFKDIWTSLIQIFTGMIGVPQISFVQNRVEQVHRVDVARLEKEINNSPKIALESDSTTNLQPVEMKAFF